MLPKKFPCRLGLQRSEAEQLPTITLEHKLHPTVAKTAISVIQHDRMPRFRVIQYFLSPFRFSLSPVGILCLESGENGRFRYNPNITLGMLAFINIVSLWATCSHKRVEWFIMTIHAQQETI
jgi:hypothetical protein